ncbi:M28 family metallopeptidase [Phytoactinopolyspora limicola]|uniref:M28 family metallopeptidase n=1 Tax=Phytoactinopolyspora limicola TaxID=2715536 RepID=UPI00140AD139|nr:M28 family peptidase [Phytoactinopolyspora limicola]
MRLSRMLVPLATAALLVACSADDASTPAGPEPPRDTPSLPQEPPDTARPTATVVPPEPVEFDAAAAFAFVEHLADGIGPREATSAAFHEAAGDVEEVLTALGYDVDQVPVPVPSGDSWGVEVPEGESANVIADPPGFDAGTPYVIVGAHLDTVPQAPGAEDNASGVAVMLELARMSAADPPEVPVRFIAFGAEEPRGPGDALHHFGSQQYVADMPAAEQDALVAMVSLDRVGVPAEAVPVCTGGTGTTSIMDALVEAAEGVDVATETCENRASDHWSFEKAELPAARLGSVPYAGYHSPDDVPSVVDPDQLDRVGTVVWAWLTTL